VKIRDEILIKAFGNRVRTLRQENGLSMQSLADIMNVEYRQVSDIETGKINTTISTASAISKALNISLSELFSLDRDK
jgi:transcriptional regulator with XRE-family HTH domain